MPTPAISIIIPTFNHLDDCLAPCVASLLKYTTRDDVEILIVPNGCTDRTLHFLDHHPDKRLASGLWFDEPLGFARACNKGIAAASPSSQYVILLNNDTILLDQPPNAWLDQLLAPFSDPTVGLTGPLLLRSEPAACDFLVFFCVAIRRRLFSEIGLLDESFEVGAGEDTAFCIEARRRGYTLVCVSPVDGYHDGRVVGNFPIFHAGEATVKDLPDWQAIFDRNSLRLADRYNPSWAAAERVKRDQLAYGNNWERTVLGHEPIDEQIYARELARYAYAATFIQPGMRVLEFGCSSGFATRLLPADIDYTGVDYSKAIIDYATDHFGAARRQFVWSTIDRFLDEHVASGAPAYDVIIAFEVLEHVRNGRDVAQRLKAFAPTVLLTTPYREPPGFWGPHHVLHHLTERDFPDFAYQYMWVNGHIASHPTQEIANLLILTWQAGQTYPAHRRILCAIPTSQRYDALVQCLQAVAFQTHAPDKLIIYDDTQEHARVDLREHAIGRYVLPLLTARNIPWEVVFTPGHGQHIAHQLANAAGYDLVWRLDDDCVAEPDTLARLLTHMADDVGAAAGAVYELGRPLPGGSSRIEDFFLNGNVQWAPDQGVHDVDFLYSSFLYRAGLVHYKHLMSPVAYHEETIFTHRLKRAGWRLVVDTSIRTHHFKSPHGGTRAQDQRWAYAFDATEFLRIAEQEWGIKLIPLGVGLGDCFAFKQLLPTLLTRYRIIILGAVYPDVFADLAAHPALRLIPYDLAKGHAPDNIYDWMAEQSWTGARGTIVDAYKEMYGVASRELGHAR